MTARNFKFGNEILPDIDPSMTADDIRKAYSSTYPALTNAVIVFPESEGAGYEFKEKGTQTVEFKPSVGRKG